MSMPDKQPNESSRGFPSPPDKESGCKSSLNDEDKSKESPTLEDTVIGLLESACSIFDNIYFAKSLGIISDQNVLYLCLNKGDWGSRLWFVTLILSARKSLRQLVKSVRARNALKLELLSMESNVKSLVNDVLNKKLTESLQKCTSLIKDRLFEISQTFVYLMIVTIDLFKIAVPRRWQRILESLSNFITLIRLFASGKTPL